MCVCMYVRVTTTVHNGYGVGGGEESVNVCVRKESVSWELQTPGSSKHSLKRSHSGHLTRKIQSTNPRVFAKVVGKNTKPKHISPY